MYYFVTRVFFNAETGKQSNSIEAFDTELAARKRFYTILAADIDKTTISYEMVQIVRENGITIASQVFDNRVAETTTVTVEETEEETTTTEDTTGETTEETTEVTEG